ncbi:hypothetical protein [Streptomyces sp. AA1529]|uniref:hypothetical protein n=1 Tax=Streptomyces sp. AA1529 TaxID=1203257 RepID=UPI003D7397A5
MSICNANPGMVNGTSINSSTGGLMRLTAPPFKPFAITLDEGVRTPVRLATAQPAPAQQRFLQQGRAGHPLQPGPGQDMARTVYEKTAALIGIDVLPIPPLP